MSALSTAATVDRRWIVAVLAVGLAAVHVGAGRLHFVSRVPRSRWLSFAGGTSIAYVFVHLLPELAAGGRAIEANEGLLAVFFERHVYLVTLVGFTAFYGLERFVGVAREDDSGTSDVREMRVFWTHVGAFALYNALIGYSLHHRETVVTTALFAVAMAFHFVVNDIGLHDDHARSYDEIGRWVLAAAVIVGAVVGGVTPIGEALFAVALAFIGGGVILNVVKEELPDERESRFGAFLAGTAGYTAILLLV